jgi:hypothetical protein
MPSLPELLENPQMPVDPNDLNNGARLITDPHELVRFPEFKLLNYVYAFIETDFHGYPEQIWVGEGWWPQYNTPLRPLLFDTWEPKVKNLGVLLQERQEIWQLDHSLGTRFYPEPPDWHAHQLMLDLDTPSEITQLSVFDMI